MGTATRLGAYALGLVAAFAAAAGLGAAVGPVGPVGAAPETHAAETHAPGQPGTAPHGAGPGGGGEHETGATGGDHGAGTGGGADARPAGLAVSEAGYTLVPRTTTLPAGRPTDFRFTITGPDGAPVTAYTREHEKDLHLIVVRRDLTGYQHLHPTLGADGSWSARLTLPTAGTFRAYADFVPAGGQRRTLGVDLDAAGPYAPRPLPPAADTATVAGYTVTVSGHLAPAEPANLTFTITRAGRPVTDLQPYLGAYGHLVVLRAGDLGYLHVHPDDGPAGPAIAFGTEVPSAGDYRLFLDFRHGGTVHTAELTADVPGAHR